MKKGVMITDGGTYPANSGVRKGPWGSSKEITANDPKFNPVIKGPVVPPSGAGNLNGPDEKPTLGAYGGRL